MDKLQLKNILSSAYNRADWQAVMRGIFGAGTLHQIPQPVILPPNELAQNAYELGSLDTADERLIGIYEVHINPSVQLERNKAGLRNLLRDIYKNSVDGALIVFIQGDKWRFSFVSEIRTINAAGEWVRQETEPKRYTYLLGKDETIRTAAERFYLLHGKPINLDDIKKAFSVDTLTNEFYKELSDWYFFALHNVKFPADAEPDESVRNATSVIRLITRLMFVWFLKQKGLISNALFDKSELDRILDYSDITGSAYYKAILQNLFFATLNTEMKTRKFRGKRENGRDQHHFIHNVLRYEDKFKDPANALKEYFDPVPFLNGGLFECLDKEKEKIRVDGFSDRVDNVLTVPDSLFFGNMEHVDLSSDYGDKKHKNQTVRGIIDILHSYNFTIEENTPFDIEVALDPELLGKVFENLLASYNPETQTTARKSTGSFYTPREIVDYMVDESLMTYLSQSLHRDATGRFSRLSDQHDQPSQSNQLKQVVEERELDSALRDLFSYTHTGNPFDEANTQTLIRAIDTCKILDPACGSGAFPMGILHKMVHILGKLDPDNTRWRELQLKKALAETEQAFREGDAEERKARLDDINRSFDENSSDYGRKLYLIENCIYGVDIQPIAAQISKLRFFISLIVDQKINADKPNLGVRPLPNLETKFVAANTLIGLNKPAQGLLQNPEIKKLEKELNTVRHNYFKARTPDTKKKYRQLDKELRDQISRLLEDDGWTHASAEQVANWNPYDQNASASFFDPEWMFGEISGFDVVIGNPPYVLIQPSNHEQSIIRYFRQNYKVASYKLDLYHLFIEKGINILKPRGVISLITPSNFTSNNYAVPLRHFLLTETALEKLVFFSDGVFDASVHNLVFICQKSQLFNGYTSFYQAIISNDNNLVVEIKSKVKQVELANELYLLVPATGNATIDIMRKMAKVPETLGSVAFVNFGMQLRDRKEFEQDVVESPIDKLVLTKFHRECYSGKDVRRYSVTFSDRYCYFNRIAKRGGCWDEDIHNAKNKILVRQIGSYPEGGLDERGYAVLNAAFMILPKNNLFTSKFLLGILNSAAIRFYWLNKFKDDRKTFPKIKGEYLKLLPFPNINLEGQQSIIFLVDRILAAKQADPAADTSALEREIDVLVYELYGLTDDEIAVVEGR